MHLAVVRGELPNLKLLQVDCVDCGRRASAHDHRDYGKPLEVDPVCGSCNYKRGSAIFGLPDTEAANDA